MNSLAEAKPARAIVEESVYLIGVGAAVGALVGVAVSHRPSIRQMLLWQSLLNKQCKPGPHGLQLPPQSVSVSVPPNTPSAQVAGVGTADALFLARLKIEEAIETKNGSAMLLALDRAKAFDSVHLDALSDALRRMGIPDSFRRVVEVMLKK